MEHISSLEVYKALLKELRTHGRPFLTNNYMSPTEVKRLIFLERIYYEMNKTGLYIFVDEEEYYRLFIHLFNAEISAIENKEKPLLIKTAYRNDQKETNSVLFDAMLKDIGFHLLDTSLQFKAEPKKFEKGIYVKKKEIEDKISEEGLHLIYAEESFLQEIKSIRDNTNELSKYHFDYTTHEEMVKNIKSGNIRCIINNNRNICAVQECVMENGMLTEEWISILPQYKGRGLGSILMYDNFVNMIENHIKVCFAWVVKNNISSIEFHKKQNFTYTGLVVDEWVL